MKSLKVFLRLTILVVFLCSCSTEWSENIPEFDIPTSDINSEIRIVPKHSVYKSEDWISLNLAIDSSNEVTINCEDNPEVYFKIGNKWEKDILPCEFSGDGEILASHDSDNSIVLFVPDPIDPNKIFLNPTTPEYSENEMKNLNDLLNSMPKREGNSTKNIVITDKQNARSASALMQNPDKTPAPTPMKREGSVKILPDTSGKLRNIRLSFTTRKILDRREILVIYIRALSRDLQTNMTKPIGAYASFQIIK